MTDKVKPEPSVEMRERACGKNMGNDLLVIPCDLLKGHEGPCERNMWPVETSPNWAKKRNRRANNLLRLLKWDNMDTLGDAVGFIEDYLDEAWQAGPGHPMTPTPEPARPTKDGQVETGQQTRGVYL